MGFLFFCFFFLLGQSQYSPLVSCMSDQMGGKLKLKVSLRKKKKKTHINRMNSKSPETHLFLETLNTVEEKRGKKASLCLSAQENVPKQSSPIRKNVILRLLIPL